MSGGLSAREQAERRRLVEESLRQKADRIGAAAANFEQGARGEEQVSWELDTLGSQGWFLLHDRRLPGGGNLDHLAIGPAGVFVVESKNWNGTISVEAGKLRVDGRTRSKPLAQLTNQMEAVIEALGEMAASIPVTGVIALVGPLSWGQPSTDLAEGVRVVGLQGLVAMLGTEPAPLSVSRTEAAMRSLTVAFPPAWSELDEVEEAPVVAPETGGGEAVDEEDPPSSHSKTFLRFHRMHYIKPWRRGAHHRLYLRSRLGEPLGWKDVKSGDVNLDVDGPEGRLAEATLRNAQPASVSLTVGELPKVPVQVPGVRILARLTGFHIAVVIGNEWHRGAMRRLYGTFVAPDTPSITLGFVDLTDGTIHADSQGPIAKDRGEAADYLERLYQNYPC